MLGVSLEERSAVVAELRLARGERYLEQAEEFQFPEGLSWEEPIPLGKALGQFLRQHRFSSNRAVIGLPAKWLLSKEVRVPPSATITSQSTCSVIGGSALMSSAARRLRPTSRWISCVRPEG